MFLAVVENGELGIRSLPDTVNSIEDAEKWLYNKGVFEGVSSITIYTVTDIHKVSIDETVDRCRNKIAAERDTEQQRQMSEMLGQLSEQIDI